MALSKAQLQQRSNANVGRLLSHEDSMFSRYVANDNKEYTEFLGNKVTCHSIPIRPGRNLAIIVESAAVNHRQKKMGYNAAQELYRRVQESISRNKK